MATALTDEQIERLLAVYAETGKKASAAAAVGCSRSTAKRYIDLELAAPESELEQIRQQKRAETAVSVIAKSAEVQIKLLEAMADPVKLREAEYRDLGVNYGIVTEKLLLMRGQATSRNESITTDPAAKLTPDEMEAAARIRAKLAAEAS